MNARTLKNPLPTNAPETLAPTSPAQSEPAWLFPCAIAALLLLTFLVYARTFSQSFIVLDDPEYVIDNQMVHEGITAESLKWAFTDLSAANWHPLTWLTHMIDWTLYGSSAWGHHLTNAVIHVANVFLLWFALTALAGPRARWWALLAASVFALHPLRVESVAWISERKDVLSVFFGLLAIHAYARYARSISIQPVAKSIVWYVTTLLWFACSLMSKAMFVTLPFLLVLLDVWPLRRILLPSATKAQSTHLADPATQRISVIRAIAEKLLMLVMSVVVSIITLAAQRAEHTVTSLQVISLARRIGNTLVAYATYLGQFLWPINLSPMYSYPSVWPAARIGLSAGVLLAATLLALWQWRKRPFILVGWLWFLGTLIPVIGLVQVGGQSHADRYTYLPNIGLCIILAGACAEFARRSKTARNAVAAFAILLTLILAPLALAQIRWWDSSRTLFSHAINVSADNYVAENILSYVLVKEGDLAAARDHAQTSFNINPSYALLADFYGDGLIKNSRWSEAAEHFEELFKRQASMENSSISRQVLAKLHNNYGTALMNLARFEQATDQFRLCLQLDPSFSRAKSNLGAALAQSGHPDQALGMLEDAARENPESAEAQTNLGHVLSALGRKPEALVHYYHALEIDPTDQAALTLVQARRALGISRESAIAFEKALPSGIDPLQAHADFAQIMMSQRFQQADLAVPHYQRICELAPNAVSSWLHLGVALGAAQR
ncbi:MAG TPA: tetratricopeptide repeat protein, partial [Phycisphaerales bacterium]|nr:tetratricopeptide repeat protein [Phycisphaerales bacterium]